MADNLPDDSPLLDPTNPHTQDLAHQRLASLREPQAPATIPAPPSAGGPQLEVSPEGAKAYFDPGSQSLRLQGSSSRTDEADRSRGWAPGVPADIVQATERGRMADRLAQTGREALNAGPPGHEHDPELNSFAEAFTAIHPLHDTEMAGLKESANHLYPHERAGVLEALRWAQGQGLTREDLERYGRQRMDEIAASHAPEPNWFGRMQHGIEDAEADPNSWWNRMRPGGHSIFDIGAGAAERPAAELQAPQGQIDRNDPENPWDQLGADTEARARRLMKMPEEQFDAWNERMQAWRDNKPNWREVNPDWANAKPLSRFQKAFHDADMMSREAGHVLAPHIAEGLKRIREELRQNRAAIKGGLAGAGQEMEHDVDTPGSWWNRMRPGGHSIFDIGAGAADGAAEPQHGLDKDEIAARDNPLSDKEIARVQKILEDPQKHAWTEEDRVLVNRFAGDRFRSYTKIIPTLGQMAPHGIHTEQMRKSTNVIDVDGRPLQVGEE